MPEPVNRRTFIRRSGVAALGAGAAVALPSWAAALTLPTEEGSVSGIVSMPGGFRVPAGRVLTFDPNVSTTVRVGANVVVEGTLRMKPASPQIVHRLVFEGIDESRFIGGGMDVLDSDVGLWVVGSGVLDIAGSPKVAWNRTGSDPTWLPTDELRVTPTEQGDFGANGFQAFTQGDPVPRVENPYGYAGSASNRAFVDTAGSPHADDIEAIAAAGVTRGCGGGRFCPDEFVTRGQMAVFLGRALGLGVAGSAGFVDTVGHPFEAEIDALAAAGVTKGCGGGRFCPDESVTREQMATFLARAFGYQPPAPIDTDFRAEVLNLSRNVIIEGKPSGRAHVLIQSSRPQSIKHAEIRHMGPRQPSDGQTKGVLGRYGVHFHHCGDGSRGSLVEGVVVAQSGNHAFVPHKSHGITMRDCIAYDVFDDAFWWDAAPAPGMEGDPTHDTMYDRCVAAYVRSDPAFRGYRLAGFFLGAGQGNVSSGCVAAGVQGNANASGFKWPELSHGVWEFRDCVAHNNAVDGIFTWQNDGLPHTVDSFLAFHNGQFGIEHGAYLNRYHYRDSILFANGMGGVVLHAVSLGGRSLTFDRLVADGPYPIQTTGHALPAESPTLIRDCLLVSTSGPKVTVDNKETHADLIDFHDCPELRATDVLFASAHQDSLVRLLESGSVVAELRQY